jgi:hypothetical protein
MSLSYGLDLALQQLAQALLDVVEGDTVLNVKTNNPRTNGLNQGFSIEFIKKG